jgi:antitoxin PrlF
MADLQSRVSTKGQTVIPKIVRERLGLKTGDRIRFRLDEKGVTIDKVRSPGDDPFASFAEWTSDEDEKLYRGL